MDKIILPSMIIMVLCLQLIVLYLQFRSVRAACLILNDSNAIPYEKIFSPTEND
jgi:hypothetical protein